MSTTPATTGLIPLDAANSLFRPRYFSESALITIYVGSQRRKFTVHKDILCSKSRYFSAALNNPLSPEAQTHEVVLRESDGHDAAAFGGVVDWLYEGPAALDRIATTKGLSLPANRRAQVALTKVYVQAHKLMVHQLHNQIVDVIVGFSEITIPSLEALDFLHDALPVDSCLERYFLDGLSYWLYLHPGFLRHNCNGWHVEAERYLREEDRGGLAYLVLKRVCERGEVKDLVNPSWAAGCRYHEHDEECPRHTCPGRLVGGEGGGDGEGLDE